MTFEKLKKEVKDLALFFKDLGCKGEDYNDYDYEDEEDDDKEEVFGYYEDNKTFSNDIFLFEITINARDGNRTKIKVKFFQKLQANDKMVDINEVLADNDENIFSVNTASFSSIKEAKEFISVVVNSECSLRKYKLFIDRLKDHFNFDEHYVSTISFSEDHFINISFVNIADMGFVQFEISSNGMLVLKVIHLDDESKKNIMTEKLVKFQKKYDLSLFDNI